ncbi:MAG TPA: response regulator [Acidimicrobiia bacterium]|nr:response regulator [Acidimicrobiia bacterium]
MRLLVCDDDPAIGKLLNSIYTATGWDVEVVTSGQDCIDAVASSPPDVLVLDHMMPGLTGIETARVLRDGGFAKPIVLFSAYLGPDLAEAARALDLMPVSKVDIQAVVRIVDALGSHPRPR